MQLRDVGETRHVFQRQRVLGQQRGDHQRQRGVLGARNRDDAVQRAAAGNLDAIHLSPSAPAPRRRCSRGQARRAKPSEKAAALSLRGRYPNIRSAQPYALSAERAQSKSGRYSRTPPVVKVPVRHPAWTSPAAVGGSAASRPRIWVLRRWRLARSAAASRAFRASPDFGFGAAGGEVGAARSAVSSAARSGGVPRSWAWSHLSSHAHAITASVLARQDLLDHDLSGPVKRPGISPLLKRSREIPTQGP